MGMRYKAGDQIKRFVVSDTGVYERVCTYKVKIYIIVNGIGKYETIKWVNGSIEHGCWANVSDCNFSDEKTALKYYIDQLNKRIKNIKIKIKDVKKRIAAI